MASDETRQVIRKSVDVPAMESSQQTQRQEINGMNTPVMSVNKKKHSMAQVAHRILEQLIYDCTHKARKTAMPAPSVQDQRNAGRF